MENEIEYLEELMKKCHDISQNLLRYIPYFEQKKVQKKYRCIVVNRKPIR